MEKELNEIIDNVMEIEEELKKNPFMPEQIINKLCFRTGQLVAYAIRNNATGDQLDKDIQTKPKESPEIKWHPVKDMLPIVGEEVLVCDYDGDMYITALYLDNLDSKWGYDYAGNRLKNIVAWAYLPKPYEVQ